MSLPAISGQFTHANRRDTVDPFDAEAIIIHLDAHGVVPGEVVERSGADGIGPSMYIHDPEGNMVELKGP